MRVKDRIKTLEQEGYKKIKLSSDEFIDVFKPSKRKFVVKFLLNRMVFINKNGNYFVIFKPSLLSFPIEIVVMFYSFILESVRVVSGVAKDVFSYFLERLQDEEYDSFRGYNQDKIKEMYKQLK